MIWDTQIQLFILNFLFDKICYYNCNSQNFFFFEFTFRNIDFIIWQSAARIQLNFYLQKCLPIEYRS